MYRNKRTRKYVEIKDASEETYRVTVSGDTLQYACEVSNLVGFDSLKMNLKLPVNREFNSLYTKTSLITSCFLKIYIVIN